MKPNIFKFKGRTPEEEKTFDINDMMYFAFQSETNHKYGSGAA